MNWRRLYIKWLVFSAIVVAGSIAIYFSQNRTPNFDLPDSVDFNFHIRPIITQNCFVCHGPDTSSRKADLRLDIYDGAIAKLADGGAPIVPGNPGRSVIIDRISSVDPDFKMPPPEAKKDLSLYEIALIRKWIKQGAHWKPHWSLIKPEINGLPENMSTDPIPDVIDFYINNQQKERNILPGRLADMNTLIRRIAYLLTGLPPTLEELKQFSNSSLQNGYEEIVDYYLASPHFGERWARHWMDLVRYGEYKGHEFDYPISGAWQYRDYLIRAFNQDVPYDLFVQEHLAGDLLEKPRYHPEEGYNESIIGTAYATLGEGKHSPVSVKEEEATTIDNMIDVTSKTFQALTVGCARCHDHKFDPIPTTDYYAMYGMFESARLGPIAMGNSKDLQNHYNRIREIKNDLRLYVGNQLKLEVAGISAGELKEKERFALLLADIPPIVNDVADSSFTILGNFQKGSWQGWRPEGAAFGPDLLRAEPFINLQSGTVSISNGNMASSRYYSSGIQGTLRSPNFIIEHDSIAVRARGDSSSIRIIVDNFQLIQNPLYGSFARLIDNGDWNTYTMDVSMVKGHKAYIELIPGYFEQHKYHIDPDNFIEVSYAVAFDGVVPKLEHADAFEKRELISSLSRSSMDQAIIDWTNGQSTIEQNDLINILMDKKKIKINGVASGLTDEIIAISESLYNPEHFTGITEGEAVFSPVFIRGSHEQLSEGKVPHQFLSAVSHDTDKFPQIGSGRLAWAAAAVHPDNPLTSRVMVNRIWHHIFGTGIVETVDNFGLQGKLPSHPELLDYLAIKFIEEGWSIKKMIRQILLSETFQKSTFVDSENYDKDPQNRTLHHFPIRRLEAEAIRDGILAVSGSLNQEMHGVSVPIYLTEFMTGRGRPRTSGPLDGYGRRSVYSEVRRNFLVPMMEVFDMPIPFSTFGKRNITNVPAQSLTLMNDPFVHDQAQKWAEHLISGTDESIEARITHIYKRAFSRTPQPEEIQEAIGLIENLCKKYNCSNDEIKNDRRLWADVCHAIFNFKEFIYLI